MDAITAAKLLLVVVSPKADKSLYVQREVDRALAMGVNLLGVQIQDFDVSKGMEFFLATTQRMMAFPNPLDEYLSGLPDAVRNIIAQHADSIDRPTPHEENIKSKEEEQSTQPSSDSRTTNSVTWTTDPTSSGIRLAIFHPTSDTYKFSLFPESSKEPVDTQTVTISEQSSRIINHAIEAYGTASPAVQQSALARLGTLMYRHIIPIGIQDYIDHSTSSLIIETEDISLPWEYLHDHQQFLFLGRNVTRAPESLGLTEALFRAETQQDHAGDKVLIIADAAGTLPDTHEYAQALKLSFEKMGIPCQMLIGFDQGSYLDFRRTLKKHSFGIIHYIGELRFLPGRQSGALVLANKQLIPADEICSALQGNPFVFIDAYDPPQQEAGTAENKTEDMLQKTRGLVQAFMHGGRNGQARSVICPMWPSAPKPDCADFVQEFYKHLFTNETIAGALKDTRAILAKNAVSPISWSRYMLFGQPILGLSLQPAQKQSAVEEAGDTLHWSDDVHTVIVGAVGAMHAMNWSFLSTIHLLLGLTYLPKGYLSNALMDIGYDPDSARRQLRTLLANENQEATSDHIEIGDNLASILSMARKLAQSTQADELDETHILRALLQHNDSGAIQILEAMEVDIDNLRKQLGPSPNDDKSIETVQRKRPEKSSATRASDTPGIPAIYQEDGSLNHIYFDKHCMASLKTAQHVAQKTNWPVISSPHIFLGILMREDSALAKRVQLLDIKYSLTKLFIQSLQQPTSTHTQTPQLIKQELSDNARKILAKAQQIAENKGRSILEEGDLLAAQLGDENNFVTDMLRNMGIDCSQLLLTLH